MARVYVQEVPLQENEHRMQRFQRILAHESDISASGGSLVEKQRPGRNRRKDYEEAKEAGKTRAV